MEDEKGKSHKVKLKDILKNKIRKLFDKVLFLKDYKIDLDIKNKIRHWHSKILFLSRRKSRGIKEDIMVIDHKFVKKLKEAIKGKDVRGKWIRIR